MTTRTFKIRLSISTGPEYWLTGFSPMTGEPAWSINKPLARQYDGQTLHRAYSTLCQLRIVGEIDIMEDLPIRQVENPVTC